MEVEKEISLRRLISSLPHIQFFNNEYSSRRGGGIGRRARFRF